MTSAAVSFGTTAASTPIRRTLFVRNEGTVDLDVSSVDLPTGYSLVGGQSNWTIGSGSLVPVMIELNSPTPGVKKGNLTFNSTDAQSPSYAVPLAGLVGTGSLDSLDAVDDVRTGVLAGVETSLDVLNNDLGLDLTITSVDHPDTSISPDGRYVLLDAPADLEDFAFQYTVTDGTVSDTAEVFVQANLPPHAEADQFQDLEAGISRDLFVLSNDQDPDSDTLSIDSVSSPALGTVVNHGDYLTYTPGPDFGSGGDDDSDTFTYTITDSAGHYSDATVRVDAQRPPSERLAIDFNHMADVTESIGFAYQRTSFNEDASRLFADLQLSNVGTYAIRGPILLGIKDISHPLVSTVSPDGYSPEGIPYYNITNLLTTPSSPLYQPGDPAGDVELRFDNPVRDPFDYELIVWAFTNRKPTFDSTPRTSVVPGKTYQYHADATDPDFDPVTYSKIAGPEDLAVFEHSGLLQWQTDAQDVGQHVVIVRATDPYGAYNDQLFTIDVANSPNRPPRFTTDPVAEAFVGETYVYPADAFDPDDDILTYSLVSGPEGLDVHADTGRVTWTPGPADLDQSHPVKMKADDGQGGSAVHEFDIGVFAQPGNLPPMIVSDPRETHVVSEFLPPATTGVSPQRINLELGPGESIDQLAQIQVSGALGSDYDLPDGKADKLIVENETDAQELLNALTAGGNSALNVTSVNLSGQQGAGTASTGVFVNRKELYGLDRHGIVLSTGNAGDYGSGTNDLDWHTTNYGPLEDNPDQEALLDPITGGSFDHYDITQFDIGFDLMPGYDSITFDVVFGSEEYIEWVESEFIDGFGLFLNGENVAFSDYYPINIKHPEFRYVEGTELDGVLVPGVNDDANDAFAHYAGDANAALRLTVPMTPGQVDNTLTFIIADTSDNAYDSTAYISSLAGINSHALDVDLESAIAGKPFVNQTGVIPNLYSGDTASFETEITGTGQGDAFTLNYTDTISGALLGTVPVTINHGYFYLVEAIDPEGDPITYELLDGPEGAEMDPETARVRWTPTAPGDYPFTVRATDDKGGSNTQDFTVEVSDSSLANQSPTIAPIDDLDGPVGNPLRVLVEGDDADDDALRYYLTEAPEGLTIDPFTGQIDWVPLASDVSGAPHDVTVKVIDRRGGEATESFTIDVTQSLTVNNWPDFTSTPVKTAVTERTYLYHASADDLDDDRLTYEVITGPEGMAIDSQTGRIAWTPTTDQVGQQPVLIGVSDGHRGVDTQSFSITVFDINADPTIVSDPERSASTGVPWEYDPVVDDSNGDSVNLRLVDPPAGMGFGTSGVIEWTPADEGTYAAVLIADDGRGGTDRQEIYVKVSDNSPARITSEPDTVTTIDDLYQYTVTTEDPDSGDNVTVSIDDDDLEPGMSFDGTTFQWTPKTLGDYDLTFTAVDDLGEGEIQSFTLSVIPLTVDSAPPEILSRPTGPIYANETWDYAIDAIDPDGDDGGLVYSLDTPTDNPDVSLVADVLSWTPGSPDITESFTVRVTDEDGVWVTQSFDATAGDNRQGELPEITSVPTGPIVRGETWTYQTVAVDDNDDPLTYSLDSAVPGAVIDPQSGMLSFDPGSNPQVSFDVVVADGVDGSITQSFTLDIVDPPGRAPEVTSTPVGPAIEGEEWAYVFEAVDADGDELSYSLESASSSTGSESVTFDTATGLATWTPSIAGATLTLTLSATDNVDGTETQIFTVESVATPSAGPGNDPPEFSSSPTGPAATGQSWSYLATATDPDDDPLSYSLDTSSTDRGMSIDSDTGRIDWTPEEPGEFPVTVIADDGAGGTASQQFPLFVVRPNVAPEITSTPEGPVLVNETWTYTVTAKDITDATDSLTLEMIQPTPSTNPSFDPVTGLLEWTPGSEQSLDFTFRVSDPAGAEGTQSFRLTPVDEVVAANSPPVVRSIPVTSGSVDDVYRYDVDATDDDNETLAYSLASAPLGMSIDPATGEISWTPDRLGTVAIDVAVSDGVNTAVSHPFDITVTAPQNANQPPEITSDATGPALRDVPWEYQAVATDPEGDELTWSLDSSEMPTAAVGDLAIDAATGLVTWTPDTDGTFPISVTATDPSGKSDTSTFNLPVLENAPPRFTSDPDTAGEVGTPYDYQAVAEDPNTEDVINYALDSASLDRGMSINASSGEITWSTPTVGNHTVIVTATDNHDDRDLQEYSLRVTDPSAPNQAPTIASTLAGSLQIGQRIVHDLEASDPDGDPLTFSTTGAPAGLTVSDSGLLDWTPSGDQLGSHPFTVTADDGAGLTAQKAFSIDVTTAAENNPPEFAPPPNSVAFAEGLYQATAEATDADGDSLRYALATAPEGMVVGPRDGLLQWIPERFQVSGTHDVSLIVNDGRGGIDTLDFEIDVVGVNRPPRLDSDPITSADTNETYTYDILATDPDGHELTYTLDEDTTDDTNGNISVDSQTGSVTWNPTAEATNRIAVDIVDEFELGFTHIFDVTVTTGTGGSSGGGTGSNTAPRFTTDLPPLEVPKEASYSYDFDATDDEGDTYTFSLPTGPSWASIDSSTGVLSGTAPDNVGELEDFKVVVTDGALSSFYDFQVRIQPENIAPTLASLDDVDLSAGATLRVDARGNDVNDDDLTYSLDSASETLGLSISSLGRITWATDDSDITSSPHTVTVTVDDSRLTANESFDLTVSADTTGPEVTVVADRASLDIGEFVNLNVDALDDVAVTDRSLTLVSVTDPSDNTTVLNESLPLGTGHTHRFDVLTEHLGELTFRATAVDAAGNVTTSDDVTVQVSDPNDITRPQVDLFPPTPQGDREQGVVIAPTDLWGTVTDDGSHLSWELTVTPLGPNGGSSETVASGNSEIPDADVLHRFDPTMLADGSYRVELIANDGTNEGRDSLILTVQGRLKLGNFDLSFTDMEIPVAGIPITVRRSYDTLDSQTSGDFGYGWDLEIVQPKISVDMSTTGRTPARINGRGYPSFVDGTRVTVTTPDGTKEGFKFEWSEVGFGFWGSDTPFFLF